MADVIGRADVELRADQTGLVKDLSDAQRKVQASGSAIEKSALSTGTAFKAGAAVAAVGFGLMTKGSLEMEKSQGDFQAATGKSRQEAVAFSKDMNGIVGTNATVGMSFDEISKAGTEVARQFGLTGKANQDMTTRFAEFAKVTGSDTVAAVEAMDATLDAFHLPAEKATEVMDALVASNQKYGTDIGPQTIEMLGKMAPALQNMGSSVDDGVALLNMFEASGLDAAGAMRGLNTAVKTMPPGQSLDGLLQHFQDLKNQGIDPTDEAVKIFGAKAGAGIANAILPGMHGLQDYQVSAEDAAGATTKASDAMVTTSDKIKMFAEKAGAALRGLGQDFGPILSGAGGLVSVFGALPGKVTGPLVDGMKAVWQKLVPGAIAGGTAAGAAEGAASVEGSTGAGMLTQFLQKFGLMTGPKVAAAAAAGALEGAAEGEAAAAAATGPGILAKFTTGGGLMGAAMSAGVVVAVAGMATIVGPAAGKAGEDIGRTVFGGIAETMGNDETKGMLHGTVFDSLTDGIHSGLDAVMDSPIMRYNIFKDGKWFWMSPSDAEQAAQANAQELFNATTSEYESYHDSGRKIAESVAEGATEPATVKHWFGPFAFNVSQEIADQYDKAPFVALGSMVPKDIASGAVDNGTALIQAGDRLIQLLKEGLDPAQQAARMEGKKYTDAVAEGVRSGIPGAKEAAQALAIQSISTISAAANGTPDTKGLKAIGSYYDSLLASGMTSDQARTALQAANVSTAILDKLTGFNPAMHDTGATYSDKLADGVTDHKGKVKSAVDGISSLFDLNTKTWGYNVGGEWITGFANAVAGGAGTIQHAINKATAATHGESPPKVGPLRNIDKWGANVAGAWVDSFAGRLMSGAGQISGALAGYNPRIGAAAMAAGAMGAGGSTTITLGNIDVHVEGSSSSAAEIADAVQDRIVDTFRSIAGLAPQRPISVSGRPV